MIERILHHFVFLKHVSFIGIKVLPKPVYVASRWKTSTLWQRGEMSNSLGKSETPARLLRGELMLYHPPILIMNVSVMGMRSLAISIFNLLDF